MPTYHMYPLRCSKLSSSSPNIKSSCDMWKKLGSKDRGEEGGTWVGWRGLSWKWSSSYVSTVNTSHMPTLDIAKWEWIDKIGSVKLGFLLCDRLHYYLNKNRDLCARKRRWNTWSKFKSMNSQWYQQTNSFGHHWSTLVKQLIVLKTGKLRERIMFVLYHWEIKSLRKVFPLYRHIPANKWRRNDRVRISPFKTSTELR